MKSILNRKKEFNYMIGLCLLILLVLPGCKKEISTGIIESDNFLHSYPSRGNQSGWYVRPTADNGCLFIGVEDEMLNLIVLKIDENGRLVRKDTIRDIEMNGPVFKNLSDGSILICSGYNNGNFCKLDRNGKLEYSLNFGGTKRWNSYPVIMKDGSYALASAYGWTVGTYSLINFIYPNGTNRSQVQINDASFGPKFKTIYTSLHRCDTIGQYYFNGYCIPNWKNTFRERIKFFVAKQKYSGNTLIYNKTVIIDSANVNYNINGLYQVNTSDNHTLFAATFGDINNLSKGRIIKMDPDLNIIWERDLKFGYTTYVNGISECPDGNYLITGGFYGSERTITQPLACKMDKNGNILWQRTMPTKLSCQTAWGEQAADGTCYFVGHANSFGNAANLMDLFLLKTDSEGNLK